MCGWYTPAEPQEACTLLSYTVPTYSFPGLKATVPLSRGCAGGAVPSAICLSDPWEQAIGGQDRAAEGVASTATWNFPHVGTSEVREQI